MSASPSKMVTCRYNDCGQVFTSKHRIREHVLWHLNTDPPKRVYINARVRYEPQGGFTVIEHLDTAGPSSQRRQVAADMGTGSQDLDQAEDVLMDDKDEVDRFRVADILPSGSQAGNITTTTTTTTTTSGGTTSQPITFSPVLPERPVGISLPTQSSYSSTSQSHVASSPLVDTSQRRSLASRDTNSPSRNTPFVHSAPSRHTVSPQREIRMTQSAVPRAGSAQPLSSFASDSQIIPSALLNRPTATTPKRPQHKSPSSARRRSPHSPGPQRRAHDQSIKPTSLVFGAALSPSGKKRTAPSAQSGVTFGFGTR